MRRQSILCTSTQAWKGFLAGKDQSADFARFLNATFNRMNTLARGRI